MAAGSREAPSRARRGQLRRSGSALSVPLGEACAADRPGADGADRDQVAERPYVLLSCAISVDGCLDSAGPERLVLSGPADLERVDGERTSSDAIMVGAGTIRRDDPRLLIRSPERRAARIAGGRPEHPIGVTLTASGDLDPGARFFTRQPEAGGAGLDPDTMPGRLVYCAGPVAGPLRRRLAGLAEVVDLNALAEAVDLGGDGGTDGGHRWLAAVLADLSRRGVRRLMVEGGADLSRQFLTGGLADELQLVIAPFFVGEPGAPRFAAPGRYPYGPSHPMVLAEAREIGPVVLLRYLLEAAPGQTGVATRADRGWLSRAIELSRRCPPSVTAFAVGAVVVAGDGSELATGYSREGDPRDHAEEAALAKLDPADPRLAGATLYSSLEPCRSRASRPRSCAELIIEAGLRRVVIAWREPPVFAPGGGAGLLAGAGITVVEIPDLAAQARAVNAEVLGGTQKSGPPRSRK
jgi:riboflavin biosynthesis pyrimidine reductase/pyrimidine deaminase RibD-like protein